MMLLYTRDKPCIRPQHQLQTKSIKWGLNAGGGSWTPAIRTKQVFVYALGFSLCCGSRLPVRRGDIISGSSGRSVVKRLAKKHAAVEYQQNPVTFSLAAAAFGRVEGRPARPPSRRRLSEVAWPWLPDPIKSRYRQRRALAVFTSQDAHHLNIAIKKTPELLKT